MLKAPPPSEPGADPYARGLCGKYRTVLSAALRARWLTVGGMLALLLVAGIGFGNVKQLFFPASSLPKFMIDDYAPEGTRIEQVAADMEALEKKLLADERVEGVTAYIGSGPPRFYLPVEPEVAMQSYGQLIVNLHDFKNVQEMVGELSPWVKENMSNALVPVREYGVGPNKTWKFELRISGPAVADPAVLSEVAAEITGILDASPLVDYSRTDWRQRVQMVLVPVLYVTFYRIPSPDGNETGSASHTSQAQTA